MAKEPPADLFTSPFHPMFRYGSDDFTSLRTCYSSISTWNAIEKLRREKTTHNPPQIRLRAGKLWLDELLNKLFHVSSDFRMFHDPGS